MWNLKLKKKERETENRLVAARGRAGGCGSSGWNGRMSEEKESKKNVDSISYLMLHSVQVFENGLAKPSLFA